VDHIQVGILSRAHGQLGASKQLVSLHGRAVDGKLNLKSFDRGAEIPAAAGSRIFLLKT